MKTIQSHDISPESPRWNRPWNANNTQLKPTITLTTMGKNGTPSPAKAEESAKAEEPAK